MKQVRIHGRGGQGVVTAAELIAIAAFKDGKMAQAFPSFGVERTGAPIESFARISETMVRTREHVQAPDVIIVQDATLLDTVDVAKGAKVDTIAIINTTKPKDELNIKLPKANIHTVDATQIALDTIGRNIVNTVILGAFAKATGYITIEGLKKAVEEKFGNKGEMAAKNIIAVERAYKMMLMDSIANKINEVKKIIKKIK